MPIQCPTCSKVNPPDAAYCFYDGRALARGSQEGPLGLGTLPFPTPLCFADGQSCANFNQLALACDERWNEAKKLLTEGVWQSFFTTIGRLDLAAVAKQAAREPDPDVGLTQLLERFPADADALRPPKLAVASTLEDLGPLAPGKNHKFELRITNQGMLVLRGMVTTDCDWLSFGDRPGGVPSLKMFQTREGYTLPVRILGDKLRAGRKPLEGQIVIDTNGGSATLPVRLNVPVRPFPRGQYANDVLAGVKSPHELALKAKAHPQEAALLFEQGAVKAWYASNGWTYPIQGTVGKGKGAVQQFFEALGLTKPPHLEIDTARIVCKGKAGQRLTKQVTISTQESRAVYAQVWSDRDWVTAGPTKAQGNTVTIPLRIDVPRRPGETLHADVRFQGNGQQQFVVPVTLAVAAAPPEEEAEPEEARGGLPLGWIAACVGLFLLIGAAGAAALVLGLRGGGEPSPPVVVDVDPPPPPPPPPPPQLPWWNKIPDLAAAAAALKESAPEGRALFDGISVKSDVERFKGYEQLGARLPELVGNPRTREPLGRFVTYCCVYEPSELNMTPLRQALASQVPRDGAEFRPEEKGGELERAFFALEVSFGAMGHKDIGPERALGLANELGTAFGFALDISAPPDKLRAQTEKLLAVRCYRNMLKTATKSVEHAVGVRAVLLDRLPQHLSAGFRDQVDVELIAAGLSRGDDTWPKLEPILKTCLESEDPTIGLKIAGLYQQAPPPLAQKMEGLLAAKWKAAANPKLTHADKVAAIRKNLDGAANRAKVSPAERLERLRKLTTAALSAVKPGQTNDTALLQDAVRLAHASAMACNLFHKDAEVDRFDELVAKVPEIEPNKSGKTDESKQPDGKPKQPAANGAIVVGPQPQVIQGVLTPASARDPGRGGAFCKVYAVSMNAGQLYTIDMISSALDSYLRLEGPNGVALAADDDGGGYPNARIVYFAPADGVYRVIATTFVNGATGPYVLQIQQGGGFDPRGFGVPRFPPRKIGFGPGIMIGARPVPDVAPAPQAEEKKEKQLNLKDLTDLGSKQSAVRVPAFNNLAGVVTTDLPPRHADKIARYLLLTIQQQNELDEVAPKLEAFAKCRHLLVALADHAASDLATQQTTEAVVGGVLGQRLRFARDEDWRSACRRMLLQRALDLTGGTVPSADRAADVLRDLYKEQGLALGIDDPEFVALTRPAQVLEGVVKAVAAKTATQKLASADREYLEQIGRQLQATRFVAENELEHLALLQRHWLRVLTLYLQEQAPARAKAMRDVQQDLVAQDRQSRSVVDQLRAGEERLLRIWALAHDLK